MLLSEISSLDLPLPQKITYPFCGAPHKTLLALRDSLLQTNTLAQDASEPGHFVGLLLSQTTSGLRIRTATSPSLTLKANDLSSIDEHTFLKEASTRRLTDAHGNQKTLSDIVMPLLSKYPEKAKRSASKALYLTLGHWRAALLQAIQSPSVQLLDEANRHQERIIDFMHWWSGTTPDYELRFHATPYPITMIERPLIEFLLNGLVLSEHPFIEQTSPTIELKILYEDETVIVINKPAGLLSVPGTLSVPNAKSLLEQQQNLTLFPAHRLDMDTSGVLMFAKSSRYQAAFMKAFIAQTVHKRYRARLSRAISGTQGTISLPLTMDPLDPPRQWVWPLGRESVTHWKVVQTSKTHTLIDFFPKTGRTHQLRMHAAHWQGLNAPIEGDPFYSKDGSLAPLKHGRLFLHSAELTMRHPITGAALHILSEPDFYL